MKQLLVVVSILIFSSAGLAEPGYGYTSSTKKEPPKVIVEHSVTSDRANNELEVKNSIENKALMGKFLSKKIIASLEKLPGIKSIQFVAGKTKSSKGYYNHNHERESHMVVQLDFVNPVSMMFKVNEGFRTCTAKTIEVYDDEDSYIESSTDCQLETRMKIEGPIAVYGNFAGTLNQEILFKNQLSVSFKYGMDYSKTNTEVDSYVYANRMDFSRAIRQVLDWSKVGISLNDPVRVTLVQAGRILKNINEDLLKGN